MNRVYFPALVSFILLSSIFTTAVAAETLPETYRDARQSFTQGRYVESQMLLNYVDSKEFPQYVMILQAQIHLAQKNIKAYESLALGDVDETVWPLALRALRQQTLARYYDQRRDFGRSKRCYRLALELGGASIQQDHCLFRLAQIAYTDGDNQSALRFSQIIWNHYVHSVYRAEMGLLLARLLSLDQPHRAQGVLSAMRRLKDLRLDQRQRRDELLIELSMKEDSREAEELAAQFMATVASAEQGRIPALHAFAVYQHDRERGRALMRSLDSELYPFLDQWRGRNAELMQSDSVALQLVIKRVQDILAGGKSEESPAGVSAADKRSALAVLRQYNIDNEDSDDYRLLLLALEAGADAHDFIDHAAATHALVALRMSELLPFESSADAIRLLSQAMKQIDRSIDGNNAVYVSLLLASYQKHRALYAKDQAKTQAKIQLKVSEIEALLAQEHMRHRQLGELWCRLAQQAQKKEQWQRVDFLWSRAVMNLPLDHLWHPLAAERWALGTLSALPPGSRLESPSEAQALSLKLLIEQLWAASWHDNSDQAYRCRYLLAQALAQNSQRTEARMCFESLLRDADDRRKAKIQKALERLHSDSAKSLDNRSIRE